MTWGLINNAISLSLLFCKLNSLYFSQSSSHFSLLLVNFSVTCLLSLPLSLSLSLSLSLYHVISLSLSHFNYLSLTVSLTLSLSLDLPLSHCLSLLSLSFSVPLHFSQSLTLLSLSFSSLSQSLSTNYVKVFESWLPEPYGNSFEFT